MISYFKCRATDSEDLPVTARYLRSLGIKPYAIGVGDVDNAELRVSLFRCNRINLFCISFLCVSISF